ncbi:cytoplasmic protein [Kwoniella heveanensis CBS 569]|uniref:Cytoplasmic protein n=1 Tax=Kwoniella heveanensis BCC8398 TaxID=1296120 RepID=A0A1B9GSD6_9TREE|nr:cytoplasmic protein [Kwoniella heveanensis BCC8398]OCF38356.1 cytoplasmic protein [Kwoniella heveanensis CBS 569]
MTTAQKIKDIEEEMAKTQRNKNTEYHLGQLKAKLAKLRRELITPSGGGGGGPGIGFDVARTGIASVGFVGFPSVGKSTLMSKLTGTHSEAASYEFTTLTTVPGTLTQNGARIQVLDLPGIIEGAKDGKGRGRQVIAVARTCNLIFIVLDVLKPLNDLAILTNELEGFGIRLNKKPPAITVKKKESGGIAITNTVPLTKIDAQEIRAVLGEYKMSNAAVSIHQPDATIEDFIDVVEGNRVYVPAIFVLNKIDAISIEELDLLYKIPNSVPISSKMWLNIDELREVMWDKLNLVRIYTKPRGQQPDYSSPVVLRRGRCTVEDFCNAIHKEIVKQFRNAMVWGTSAKHARGQKVGLDHVLEDEEQVCYILFANVIRADS